MRPVTLVLSLPVADPARTLAFYRDGLGLDGVTDEGSIVSIELPNLSLFLIERGEYASYPGAAGIEVPGEATVGSSILSCAMASRDEVDDALRRAAEAGGTVPAGAAERDGSYMGYFADPDGHVWELVANEHTAAAAGEPATGA